MKVNIKDVAKEANVSMSTVSRVLNNNYPVKEETRERVEKAIEKLNFNPNILARSLINQNTKTIGVIAPSINNLFFPTVIKAIEHVLRINGYSIYLCDTDDQASEEVAYIKSLLGRQVDGLIVIDPKTENIKKGFHENIIFVRGKKSYSYDLKEGVYKKILEEYGLKKNKKIINIGEGNSYETVDNTMNIICKKLEGVKPPIAVFACNDLMALGVMNACKKLGYDIPSDVSIIGFDNIAISSLVEPKLTTVDQNMYLLGENAANMLLDIIKSNNKKVERVSLDTQLIIRNSCAKVLK